MNVEQRQALMEAVKYLDDMEEGSDAEIEHSRAENVLCAYLRATGSGDLADAFDNACERVGFWYA